ncbi:7-carboxy-7-deazaguanine synthase [Paenibacillus cisolokensis]|uniref:7-carboxy-7-deazaguanine synthase n=1 Tax=Paenibacillus cisolokensis TaxID=1658519 RepID=A0ABQ4ND11_9BACL|nr:7-carboxy-7-deazaguanine synthase [Paenibacillus cisolokensis]
MTPEAIYAELRSLGGDRFSHVTLSGGNPALLPSLGGLVALLKANGIRTAVETQGSRWQDWLAEVDEVTLSPKPPSSRMETDWQSLDGIVSRLQTGAGAFSLKVVVFDDVDLAYAERVRRRYEGVPMFVQVGNPDVRTDDAAGHAAMLLRRYEWLIGRVADSPALNDARVLPQLHALVWGNRRGV